jgi:hypothetical protein
MGFYNMRLFAVIVSLLYPTAAWAQDCDGILKAGLLNSNQVIDQTKAQTAAKSAFCSMSESESQSQHSLDLAAQYLPVGNGSLSNRSAAISKFRQENCGSSSSSSALDHFHYDSQQAVASGVVESWRQCMLNRDGLTCFAAPDSHLSGIVDVVLSWRDLEGRQPTIRSTDVVGGDWFQPSQKELYSKNEKLLSGDQSIPFKRTSNKEDFGFFLNVAIGTVGRQCSVTITKDEPVRPPAAQKLSARRTRLLTVSKAVHDAIEKPPPIPTSPSGVPLLPPLDPERMQLCSGVPDLSTTLPAMDQALLEWPPYDSDPPQNRAVLISKWEDALRRMDEAAAKGHDCGFPWPTH